MTDSPMTALNKQALRQAAEKATAGQWVVELGDEVYAVDGDDSEQIAMMFSDNGRSDAAFIAAASPVAVLSLLDENLQLQRDKDSLEAVAIALRDDMRDAREKLEAAKQDSARWFKAFEKAVSIGARYEKRIAELEARTVTLPPTFWYEHDDLSRDIPVLDKRLVKKAIRAAGIGVKGE
ncbi:ead/Ea22-like family protein [Citrobacter europaeus]|uniref:ead/Ea22-like family protein n=1 Tax=Citrobacter europaeus TaxID=1914243 RepID=UPI00335BC72E